MASRRQIVSILRRRLAAAPTDAFLARGGPHYTETSGWTSAGGGYSNPIGYAAGTGNGTPTAVATWQLAGLSAGSNYTIQATWVATTNRASNATYRVYEGATLLLTAPVDQRLDPVGSVSGGSAFQTLGVVALTGTGPLRVTLGNDADGYVIADAIHVVSGL